MPIYTYRCNKCEEEFRVSHSMTEKQEICELCESIGTLTRVPALFSNSKIERKQKVGALVRDFINESKEDLKEQKKDLRN